MAGLDARMRALEAWLQGAVAITGYALEAAPTDASTRRYHRLRGGDRSLVVMDAPPESQSLGPYLDVAARLHAAGVHVPEVLAVDEAQGFALISDLGSTHYLDVLDEQSGDPLYGDAIEALLRMQARVSPEGLPEYDEPLLARELGLFRTWFLERHLGLVPGDEEGAVLEEAGRLLVAEALAQPRCFVHRDFHSRNLMVCPENNPGVLDFQDAVRGPVAYDLVSLLRDCYIAWSEDRVQRWLEDYHRGACRLGVLTDVEVSTLRRWMDMAGVQRHLKAIGIFARLYHRDGKPGYLRDIPRTLDHLLVVSARYPALSPLEGFIRGRDLRTLHLSKLAEVA